MIKRTLYFGNPASLRVKNNQLNIRLEQPTGEGVSETNVPIEDIGIMIVDNQQICLTQRVLQMLLENNSALIVCDEKHLPSGLLLSLSGNTLQSERYAAQLETSVPLKKQLWQQTVIAKIKNQAAVLKKRKIAVKNMLQWVKDVTSGDSANHEARAAAYYWDSLFGETFNRSRFGDTPNNLLNYGYAVLRATVARSLVAAGLLPTLGIHHHNRYNAYCLADDIMEPYRPYVDELVLEILDDNFTPTDVLTPELKRKLLIIPTLDVIIDGQRSPLMIATQRTAVSLSQCYAGETKKILYPIM